MSDNPFALSNIEPQQDSATASDNPFALGAIQRDQRQDLRVNLESAVRTNPQQAAEAARLAKKYETPDEVLLRNLQDVKLRDAVAEADKKLQTSPRLADYMRTSPFALKQAHDDIDALASIEKFFADSWGSVKAGVYNTNRGAGGLFQAVSEVIAPPLDWMESMTSIGGNPLRRLAEGFALNAQQSQEWAKAAQPKTDGIASGGVQSGIQSLTQNVLALPVAVMNPAAGLAMMSGFAGGQSYSDAREKGLTTNQALLYAASQAAIEAATEKNPLGKLLDSVKEGTLFFKSLVQSMAAEIPGEQVATVLQDLNEWAVLNLEKPFSSYLEERPSAAAKTLIATIVGTGGNVAVVKAAESVANRMTTGAQKARDAQVSAAGLMRAMQAAEASILRTNNPDEFRAVMEHLAQGGKVYVDAQVLNQLPPEQLQALGVAESLPEALAANSSVEVKLSDLLTHAPGTPAAQVLIDNARATPDGLSAIEAQQASDQAGEFIKTEAERVLAEAQDATAWQDSTNKVKQGVLDQLNSAGRFSPEVNEAYATLQSSFFSVMAQRLGTTPEELFARYKLRVEAKLPGQGERLDQSVTTTGETDEVTGLPLNSDGTVTVYHHTSAANAEAISKSGKLKAAAEPDVYVTTRKETDTGYGDTAVAIRVKPDLLQIDDEFPDGRIDFRIPAGKPGGSVAVQVGEAAQALNQPTQPLPDTIEVDGKQRPTTNSNGQPIAATEEGVRNFWKWFGDSKVVDASGKPLVVYHGTASDFTEFKPSRSGNLGPGIYFTPDIEQAQAYARTHQGAQVVEAYLSVQNPLRIDNSNASSEQLYGAFPGKSDAETVANMRAAGYDAVWAVNSVETRWGPTTREIAVYDPTQIKSAIGNNGEFDPANPSILAQNSQAPRGTYSPSLPAEIEVDGKQRPTTNSNGQPIAATEEGVRNFWKWFGESAATERAVSSKQRRNELRPLVVYHGTRASFDSFAPVREGNVTTMFGDEETVTRHGIFFAESSEFADTFAKQAGEGNANVVPVYLKIENPLYLDEGFTDEVIRELVAAGLPDEQAARLRHRKADMAWAEFDDEDGAAMVSAIRAAGYDGALMVEPGVGVEGEDAQTVWVALDPTQIKSATGNSGGFDPANPSILAQNSQAPRGTYSPSQVLITLGESADLSTFLHESAHFFLEVMADLASQPDAPAGVVDDFNTFLKWAGVKGDENVGGADSGTPLAQTSDVSDRVLQAEQIIAGIDTEEQTVLYHSGDASIDAQLAEGIDPTFGPWLEEVLAGAVDDADTAAAIREQDPVAFYSEEPTWVAMKVAKVLRKPVRDVTVDDIRQHGQISIVVVDQDDSGIWREQGDGTAEQFTGKARRSYTMNEVPFGVERGDVFTTDAFVPEITLTGDDLVRFLQRNAPGKNNLPKAQTFAQNGPAPEARPVQVKRTPLETWNAMTLDQKRPYHEKWAESFEQYLLEGKAPTAELQPLFRRFSAWLKNVYKSLTEFMRARDLKVSDEIRGVFDRMLAAEDQIKAAEQAAGMLPDFEATNEAIEKLQARSLRDLKWTVGARSKALKALQREAANLRKAVKAEVTAEVEQMPEFKAQREIAEFKRENKRKANDVERAIIAEANGFESADAMTKAIDLAGKKADMIEGKTDQRMLENFGELATPEALEAAANDAVHNEARARALATELKAQADMLNPRQDTGRTASNGRAITVNALTEAAKQFAQNLTARRRVKDLKNAAWQHRSAESRAAKAWQEATAKGKTEEAVAAKRDQLLNNYTAKAMGEAQAEVRKVLEFFAKVTKGNNEKLVDKGRDPDVVNAARAVLAAYDIAPRLEKTANDYMEAVAKYDAQMYGALKPGLDAMLANAKPFGELTVDEMRALRDEIGSMWELAKTSRQMEIDGDRVDIDDAAQDLVNRMVEIGVPDEIPGEKGAITNRQELGIKLQFAKAILSRVEQWAERMDGKFGGPFLRYVFQPVKDAADRYRAARVQYREKFTKLVEGVAPFIKPGPIAAPELGYTFGNARDSGMAELLHALTHTGNDSNKRKLLLGRNWATENADGTLDTTRWDTFVARLISEGTLRKEHYDFAQGVWDLLEETKPLAQEAHRKVFGRYFAEVTANEFTTPFGVYRGGYAPAQTDSRLVGDAKLRELAEGENESMAYAFPSAPSGFTNSRVEYNKPLLLDLRALAQHMDKVLLFSHMQPAIADARRLLTRKNVSYALDRIDPGAYEGMLMPWLNRSAKQIVETPIAGDRRISRFMGAVRSRAGMALMMANLSNTVQQITGFSTAAIKVKPSLMLKAVGQFTASPKEFKRSVAEASAYMKDRMLNEVSTMNDAVEQILVDPTLLEKGQAWTQKHAYFLQSAVDNTMSPIIWTAAYNQAIEEGSEARDAVRFADGVIRQTQGSTLPEDVSRFETGPAVMRVFTQFVGYFNMMANTNATAMSQVVSEMGVKKGAGKLAYIALAGLLVPIWVAEAIAQAFRGGPGDEDDDGYLDDWLMAVFGLGTLRGMTAQIPIAGQVGQMAVSRFNNNPADDKFSLSPAVSLIESAVGSPASVYKAIIEDGNAQKAVRDVAAAATLLTGLPFYAAARPVGYATGVAQGKIEPTDAVDAVRGTVTGTASKESKTP